jgi:hypothetical protein
VAETETLLRHPSGKFSTGISDAGAPSAGQPSHETKEISMFRSRLRVVVGMVAAVGALSVTAVAGATIIPGPGGGTTPQPIKTNPTLWKLVQVGVAFGDPVKQQAVCDGWEDTLNHDLDVFGNAGDNKDKREGAYNQYKDDYNKALEEGCFVIDP